MSGDGQTGLVAGLRPGYGVVQRHGNEDVHRDTENDLDAMLCALPLGLRNAGRQPLWG